MARKPSPDSTPEPVAPAPAKPADPREKIVDTLMDMLARRRWSDVGLSDIAHESGVGLAKLRELFPSKGAILGAFVRRIDLDVLDHDVKDMADEPARERLFDVLMRRFEALAPYRDALRSVRDGLRADPMGAAAMNQVAVSSMQWMLAAAGVQEAGPIGTARAQGLVLVLARVFETFLNDPDEDLARTMKALDEELRRGEKLAHVADDVERVVAPFRDALGRIFGRGGRRGGGDEAEAA